MTNIPVWHCFPVIAELYEENPHEYTLSRSAYFKMLRDLIIDGPVTGKSDIHVMMDNMTDCIQHLSSQGWNEHDTNCFYTMMTHVLQHLETEDTEDDDSVEGKDENAEDDTDTVQNSEDMRSVEGAGEDDTRETKGIEVGHTSPIPCNVLNDPYMVWLAGYVTAKVFEKYHTSE